MSAIWNPFVASTVTLRTSLSPDACAERLGQHVKVSMEGAPRSRKPLAGRVTPEAFAVWWRSDYAGSIAPAARGRFESDSAGTVILVRIQMKLTGWIWVIAWTAFSLLFGCLQVARELGDLQVPAPERVAHAVEALTAPAIMLALLGAGLLISCWIHRREAGEIIETLKTSLEAEPDPDFRPLR